MSGEADPTNDCRQQSHRSDDQPAGYEPDVTDAGAQESHDESRNQRPDADRKAKHARLDTGQHACIQLPTSGVRWLILCQALRCTVRADERARHRGWRASSFREGAPGAAVWSRSVKSASLAPLVFEVGTDVRTCPSDRVALDFWPLDRSHRPWQQGVDRAD